MITQNEADDLLELEKSRIDDTAITYPNEKLAISIPLQSIDRRENFILDLSRGKVNLLKGKYQTRARQVVVLARLDFGGAPHRNPDGEKIMSPHLHLFREGFDDKWAFPLDPKQFVDPTDQWQTLDDFMLFCKIMTPPIFQRGLLT